MSAVPAPAATVVPMRAAVTASGPHPAAAALGARADAAKAKSSRPVATSYRRARAPEWLLQGLAMIAGLVAFVALWEIVARRTGGRIPSPAVVWQAAVAIFSDPFYSKGPNDQGIGWNVLSSLKRVGIGFGLAAAVGIPAGFLIGRFKFLSGMAAPIIALLKPVSPLAWLPIGLLLFKAANPAAIYVTSSAASGR